MATKDYAGERLRGNIPATQEEKANAFQNLVDLAIKQAKEINNAERTEGVLNTMEKVTPEIQANLREEVVATKSLANEQKANREKMVNAEDRTFWDQLKTPGGIAAGVASLGALAMGEKDAAAGLFLGGLQGAVQGADMANKNRQDLIAKSNEQELAARQASIQASLGEMGTLSNMFVALSGQENDLTKSVLGFLNSNEQQLVGAELTKEQMAIGHANGLDLEAVRYGYQIGSMEKGAELTEEQMTLAQSFELEKIGVTFDNSMSREEFLKTKEEGLQLSDQEWRSAENAFGRAHEETLQNKRLSHDEYMNALDRELKTFLQEDSQEYGIFMQAGEQAFTREMNAVSFEQGIHMRKLDADIEKELMRMGFDQEDAQSTKQFYRTFLMNNPRLAGEMFTDNPLFQDATGASAEKISAAEKKIRMDIAADEFFQQSAIQAFNDRDGGSLKFALHAMGLEDRIPPDLLASITTNFDVKDLEKLYMTMLPDMSPHSKAISGKYLAQNPKDYAGAIDRLQARYDPDKIGFQKLEKVDDLYGAIFAAAREKPVWDFQSDADAKKFIEEIIGSTDTGFLVNNNKIGDVITYLRTNDYNEFTSDVANAHAMLRESPEYLEANAEKRRTLAVNAAISNKKILLADYNMEELVPHIEKTLEAAKARMEKADAKFNPQAAKDLIAVWLRSLPPGTTKEEAGKFIDDQTTAIIDAYDPMDMNAFKKSINSLHNFYRRGRGSEVFVDSLVDSAYKEAKEGKK